MAFRVLSLNSSLPQLQHLLVLFLSGFPLLSLPSGSVPPPWVPVHCQACPYYKIYCRAEPWCCIGPISITDVLASELVESHSQLNSLS